jgi:hypothetical protein
MALRKSRGTTPRRRAPRRRVARTAVPVRAAAARAVERVLSSPDAFALLIGRLEAEGWRVERSAAALVRGVGESADAAPVRER